MLPFNLLDLYASIILACNASYIFMNVLGANKFASSRKTKFKGSGSLFAQLIYKVEIIALSPSFLFLLFISFRVVANSDIAIHKKAYPHAYSIILRDQ